MEGFDLSQWAQECAEIENTNNVVVEGYLLAAIDNAVYVECQQHDVMVKVVCDDVKASTRLLIIKQEIETGINSIAKILDVPEDELPDAMIDFDAKRRKGTRYEVGSITTDTILCETDTLGAAMAICYRNRQHCFIIDRHAQPGDVRRWEFDNGHMVAGSTRPN
jgi:hypothetical protein